jgi:hypothetical protein
VFPANLQSGDEPPVRSFARVETPNVVLSALKQPEDATAAASSCAWSS